MSLPGLPELVFIALPFIVFGLVILGVVKLVKPKKTGASVPGALGLLEERYARGEISRDEFLERRAVLSGRPPAAQ